MARKPRHPLERLSRFCPFSGDSGGLHRCTDFLNRGLRSLGIFELDPSSGDTAQCRSNSQVRLVAHFGRVTRLVIFYLELQELMDCRDRLCICAGDFHLGPFLSSLGAIRDLVLQTLHSGRSRWCLRVNEHRYVEIALLEESRNVIKMLADRIAACLIVGVIGFDFDNARLW